MILVIDGHNLIPKVPGLHLRDLDDETHLTQYIQEYCRVKRASAELYFDGELPGFNHSSKSGLVHVHSIRKGNTADEAIITFLNQHSSTARNYTLVSSDMHIQVQARSLGTHIITSDQFARELLQALSQADKSSSGESKPLSATEVDEWLEIFSKNDRNNTKKV
jgi:uncharacterized protein